MLGQRWVRRRRMEMEVKLLKLHRVQFLGWTRGSSHLCRGDQLLHILGMILKLVTFDNELIEPPLLIFILFYFILHLTIVGKLINFFQLIFCMQDLELPPSSMLYVLKFIFFFHRLRKQYQVDLGLEWYNFLINRIWKWEPDFCNLISTIRWSVANPNYYFIFLDNNNIFQASTVGVEYLLARSSVCSICSGCWDIKGK